MLRRYRRDRGVGRGPVPFAGPNAQAGAWFGRTAGAPRLRLPSDHFDGTRFFNPGVDTDKSLGDLWRWRRARTPAIWPDRIDLPAYPPPAQRAAGGEVLLTYIGQATVLIQVPGLNILTDPIFSERASPVAFAGPKRVRAPGIDFDALPPIDLVLLSHNHYDHLDRASLARLARRGSSVLVTGLGNRPVLRGLGLRQIVELDWWETCHPLPGVEVSYVPAQHWSSRTLADRRKALWGGHVVRHAGGTLYFAGDSGYGRHFGSIAERFRPDLALLPIGAYEPRWFMRSQHMNPDDAVKAHLDLGVGLSLAIHWGTFQLTDEALEAPLRELVAARLAQGVPAEAFVAPPPGEVVRWTGQSGVGA